MSIFADTKEGVMFIVKVVPGSSRTQIAGPMGQMLKIKVAAAPEKGKANDCLIDFLAEKLGIRKNAIVIVSGHTSPIKQIRIEAMTSDKITQQLGFTENN
ncbi:MAG TPA: DUF167 domain-containing protein [Anaerohalosphaeraceae bacterium]|nr:DUF167 domain-containing protein [Anaerohalosphaeraceae bacterium]